MRKDHFLVANIYYAPFCRRFLLENQQLIVESANLFPFQDLRATRYSRAVPGDLPFSPRCGLSANLERNSMSNSDGPAGCQIIGFVAGRLMRLSAPRYGGQRRRTR